MSDDALIRSLLARIAHLADDGDDLTDYLALFTRDAVWEMPANPLVGAPADRRVGRAEIEAGVLARRAARLQGPGTATRHVLTTIAVELTSAERAVSVAYWMFFADTTATPCLVSMGRYDDVLHRADGRWRLHHRTITVG